MNSKAAIAGSTVRDRRGMNLSGNKKIQKTDTYQLFLDHFNRNREIPINEKVAQTVTYAAYLVNKNNDPVKAIREQINNIHKSQYNDGTSDSDNIISIYEVKSQNCDYWQELFDIIKSQHGKNSKQQLEDNKQNLTIYIVYYKNFPYII